MLWAIGTGSVLVLSACQQESFAPTEPAWNDALLDQAGTIHNEMIAYYYENRQREVQKPADWLAELVDLSWEYLDRNGFGSDCTAETRQAIEARITSSHLKGASGKGFSLEPSTFIPQLSETGLFSHQFLNEIQKILLLVQVNDNRQKIRDYVNSTFLAKEFMSGNDIKGQLLYVNIFNASYEFWEAWEESSRKGTALKRSTIVIINDGIGGLLGMVFGPVGSIVTATVFSAGTNEELKD